jgi:hypothetical protein
MSIPACAARPTATITEIGVASPNAQGQAIINTAIAFTKAKTIAGSGPKIYQTTKVMMLIS